MEDGAQLTPRPAAVRLFGDRLALAERYAVWLAAAGVERGLIGPREVPRLWDRHLLNCGVVQEVLPERATVADVGSGAGLPGLVLALARPDLRLTLVEPLLRRADFLSEVVADLELDGVEVVRSRAEDLVDRSFDVVTSRAVAPLPRLLGWCVPLTRVGGVVAAMKGSSAVDEIDAIPHQAWFRSGLGEPELLSCGAGLVDPQVTVVRVERVRRARVRLSGRGGSDAPPGAERSAARRRSRRPGR